MALVKKCRHGRGRSGQARRRAWRRCGCTWYADVYVAGRRRYVRVGPDERQARADHGQLVADREAGRLTPGGAGLAEVGERWLERQAARPDARPNSLRSYRSRLRHLAAWFGDVPVERIRTADVRDFVTALEADGLAPSTIGGIYAALSGVLGQAVEEGLIAQAPMPARAPVRMSSPARRHRLTFAQAQDIVEALDAPWSSLAEVALLTGLRLGELLALAPADVDLELGLLRVRGNLTRDGTVGPPKTSSGARAVPLSPRAAELLAARVELADGGPLWSGYRSAQNRLAAVLRELGLHEPGVGWHIFRNAHAAVLDAARTPLRDAGERLGHGPNTTQSLAYGWSAERGDAAAVDEVLARRH